jgi:hypothetical protein
MLKDHAAQDITRYDFLKDVTRVERVVQEHPGTRGFAILLTNDSAYWTESRLLDPVDAAFRLQEGRTVSASLRWSDRTGPGTSRGREVELVVVGPYVLGWRDYSKLPVTSYGRFRYMLVPGSADALTATDHMLLGRPLLVARPPGPPLFSREMPLEGLRRSEHQR